MTTMGAQYLLARASNDYRVRGALLAVGHERHNIGVCRQRIATVHDLVWRWTEDYTGAYTEEDIWTAVNILARRDRREREVEP